LRGQGGKRLAGLNAFFELQQFVAGFVFLGFAYLGQLNDLADLHFGGKIRDAVFGNLVEEPFYFTGGDGELAGDLALHFLGYQLFPDLLAQVIFELLDAFVIKLHQLLFAAGLLDEISHPLIEFSFHHGVFHHHRVDLGAGHHQFLLEQHAQHLAAVLVG
jgi:hypothetical protein